MQYAQQGVTGPFGLRVSATGLATTAALGAGTLEVFPNPASHAFTLQLPALGSEHTAEMTLRNSLSQVVQTRTISLNPTGTRMQVAIPTLPAGLYMVSVRAGQRNATRQLVVQ